MRAPTLKKNYVIGNDLNEQRELDKMNNFYNKLRQRIENRRYNEEQRESSLSIEADNVLK